MIKPRVNSYNLIFRIPAKTSRGVMRELKTWYIELLDTDSGNVGWGECCVLPGLSIDSEVDYDKIGNELLSNLPKELPESEGSIFTLVENLVPPEMPSFRMGLETALLDLINGGKHHIFPGDFCLAEKPVEINGLVWMGHSEFMLQQISERIYEGFRCIKMKIGGLDFDMECDIIEYVRRRYFKDKIVIRLDANGSFTEDIALNRLERLSKFDIHSIEQPLPASHPGLPSIIKKSPIPVALDEELIGIHGTENKRKLLQTLKPAFVVLKPSLLGGFSSTGDWIRIANEMNIGWWITSALESNIGLNAIAQYTAKYSNPLPQGLGTGKLYENNWNSPLKVMKDRLIYKIKGAWALNVGDEI